MPTDPPGYARIAAQLAEAIDAGTYPPGAKLPAVRELMETHGVALLTAQRALQHLVDTGLAEARERQGFYVVEPVTVRRVSTDRYARAQEAALGIGPFSTPFTVDHAISRDEHRRDLRVRFEVSEAPDDIAARLALDPSALVLIEHLRFFAHGRPQQMSTSYLPYELVRGTAVEDPANEPWPGGTQGQMAHLGISVTHVDEYARARPSRPEERQFLDLRTGRWVIAIRRTHFAADRPVETCDIVMPADATELHTRIIIPERPRDQGEPGQLSADRSAGQDPAR
jgi:GntR family transcriptional regulator